MSCASSQLKMGAGSAGLLVASWLRRPTPPRPSRRCRTAAWTFPRAPHYPAEREEQLGKGQEPELFTPGFFEERRPPATSPRSQSTASTLAPRTGRRGYLIMESTGPDRTMRPPAAASKGANPLLAGTGEGINSLEMGDLDLGWKLSPVPCGGAESSEQARVPGVG